MAADYIQMPDGSKVKRDDFWASVVTCRIGCRSPSGLCVVG
jgi:hypothetical protein